ncbi:uncharacterized protein LOC143248517 [Tachypleus tridentatus]|uniref:uncharacterized protein LOC143248517 n=1 Tax=Tachypleus tridentatus TaxID=6853 RepID=UPI003FD288CA
MNVYRRFWFSLMVTLLSGSISVTIAGVMKLTENCGARETRHKLHESEQCVNLKAELRDLYTSPFTIDTTKPSRLCEFFYHIHNCTRVFLTMECLTEKEKLNFENWRRLLNAELNYLCENNQLILATLINGNASSCDVNTNNKHDECVDKLLTFIKNFQRMFHMSSDCRIAEDAFGCIDTIFTTCSQDVRDIYKGLIETFMEESNCFENLGFPLKLKMF